MCLRVWGVGGKWGATKSYKGRARLQGAVAKVRCAKELLLLPPSPPPPPPQDPLFGETPAAFLPKRENLLEKNTIGKEEKEVKGGRERKRKEEGKKKTLSVFLDTSTPVYVGENL